MLSQPVLSLELLQAHPYLTALALFIAYIVLLGIYRFYFHPLAHIPGPPLAVLTQWTEFYYDVVLKGQFQSQFPRWHKKYGPLIRINPNELHCIDPAFIDSIYASSGSGKKRDKNIFYLNGFQLWQSTFGSVTHDQHRARRAAMNPFFSKASVTRLEDCMRGYIDRICGHIESYASTGEACNLSWAFMCLSTDIITEFSFGWDRGYTQNRTFQPNLMLAMKGGVEMAIIFRHIPFLLPVVENWLPEWVAEKMMEGGSEYFRFQNQIFDTVDDVLAGKQELNKKEGRRTIFKDILEGNGPESEKVRQRLREGAREVIGAGTLTTASALTVCSYYLLANPQSMAKLYAELEAAIPNPASIPPSTVLEKLPYLNAVLHEALRFSCGLSTRLPRVPHEALIYTSDEPSVYNPASKSFRYTIPARTIIGMSTYLMHSHPDIFPEPEKWRPERWLDENGQRRRDMDGYLLAFSKGSRQCLGINLAWTELHLVLATFVRRLGKRLELYDTGIEEVEYSYDAFEVGRASHKGVRVMVH